MSWVCGTCGQTHDDVPLSFAADYPDDYANIAPSEREQRCVIGSDQCVIYEEQFYIRGCLEIPIQGSHDIFLWGLWASVWREDYEEIAECWEEVGRENKHGPFKGRLANDLRVYQNGTANLKLQIKLRPVSERPLFFIDESDNELAVAQKQGMTWEDAQALAERLLHAARSQ